MPPGNIMPNGGNHIGKEAPGAKANYVVCTILSIVSVQIDTRRTETLPVNVAKLGENRQPHICRLVKGCRRSRSAPSIPNGTERTHHECNTVR